MEAKPLKIQNILLFVILIYQLSSVLASTALGDFSSKRYPGYCYVGKGQLFRPGKHDFPPCAQLDCSSNGWVQLNMCSTAVPEDGCYDAGFRYPKAKYPSCCQKIFICEDDN